MSSSRPYAHLIQVEVGGIQRFIYESRRLREWRGASALLDRIERRDLDEALAGGPGGGASVEVIRRGGGVVLLGVTEQAEAATLRALQRRVEAAYRRAVPGVEVYGACVDVPDGADVPRVLSRMSYATARQQGLAPVADADAALLMPLARLCDSCGERPAERPSPMADTAEIICQACHVKGELGRQVRRGLTDAGAVHRFAAYAREHGGAAWTHVDVARAIPDDLSDLADQTRRKEVALILADGNRLGQTIQALSDFEQYARFSQGVARVVEEAVFEALLAYPPTEKSKKDKKDKKGSVPWEIVFLGGDDIQLLTTGAIALDLTKAICDEVEARSADLFRAVGLTGRDQLSMAAGVVVADAHVPIGVLQRLAGELEGSAKKRAYEAGDDLSTVDFHRITAGGTTSLKAVREDELRPARPIAAVEARLTRRPFTTAELGRVLDLAREWKDAGLPKNKLHYLRERLFVSPAEAMRAWTFVLGRATRKDRHRTWQSLGALHPEASGRGADGRFVVEAVAKTAGGDGQEAAAARYQFALPWLEGAPGPDDGEPALRTYLLDVIDTVALLG